VTPVDEQIGGREIRHPSRMAAMTFAMRQPLTGQNDRKALRISPT